jgi:ATP-dependent helicase/DNAse subunit B
VLITSIDETRGLSMGTMIVAGLVDGEFPFPYQPEVFLSAERRRERERRSQWQNRYLFYQAITNWADHLYLTFPRREGECELVRSSFIDSLLQIADLERWEGRGDLPFENDLLSEDEVLMWAAGRKEEAPQEVPPGLLPALSEVRHAAAVERHRMVQDAMPGYAGILSGGLSVRAQSYLEGTADRPVSATQLETYGKCPYRYFAERLLELRPPRDLEEELTALEKGSLLHEVLFEFYRAWREKNKPALAGCSEETFGEATTMLTRILEEKLLGLDIPDDFWQLETELLLGGSGRRQGFVREFLRAEQTRSAESLPSWFEVSFGGKTGKNADPRLSQDAPVEVGSLRLRGKVDRVELADDFFSIVDYKTGEVRARLDDIRRGVSLQLPLYMLAMQSILARTLKRDLRPAAGLYYQLKSPIRIVPGLAAALYRNRAFGSSVRSRQILKSVEEFDAVLQESVGKAEEFVRGIRAGRFPLTSPDNIADVCSLCDFKVACRIQAARHVASERPEEP